MKTKFQQNGKYGCGLFSVANAFNMGEFITPPRVRESINGNNIFQLSTWLIEDSKNMYISPFYATCFDQPLSKELTGLYNMDGQHTPLLISGMYKRGQLQHMVCAMLDSKSILTILDSYTGIVTEIPFSNIETFFEVVNGIYGFVDNTSHDFIGFINDYGQQYLNSLNEVTITKNSAANIPAFNRQH